MAWYFAPLVFFLFVGVMRFKMTVGAAELDILFIFICLTTKGKENAKGKSL